MLSVVMAFKYTNCLKVVFDHLRFSLNASNAVLMCRISVKKKKKTIFYSSSVRLCICFFEKDRGVRLLEHVR